jgi:DNA-binding response OmpR family regulator
VVKILVIDDDFQLAAALADFLHGEGFESYSALDALTGLQMLKRTRPDLVLLDLMLPAGGGQLVLEGMKNSDARQTPVIVFTASTDRALKRSLLPLGVNSVLQKPVDPKLLVAEIRRLLPPDIAPAA